MDTRMLKRLASENINGVILLIFVIAVATCEAQSDQVTNIDFTSATFTGIESAGEIMVTVRASGATSSSDINVMISLTEGTAKDNDFNTTPLIATIPAGATNTTVRVAVTNDNIVEGNEIFSMSLNVSSSLGPGVVAGSITNATGIIIDSSRIRVRFTQIQYFGSEATGFVMVTLELVGGTSSNPFNVTVTPSEQSPVSAESGVDFDNITLTATFESGMTMSSVSVPVIDDKLAEGENETFDLMLIVPSSLGPAITAEVNRAVGVIIDTTMLVVEFKSERYTGSELSENIKVIVILNGSSTTPIGVMMTTIERTATGSGIDFDSNPVSLTFAAGEVNKSVNVPVMCDKIMERTERFDICLTLTSNNPQVRASGNKSQIRIRDSTVVVNFKQSSYEVMEDGGEVMIVIELSQPSSKPFDVMVSLMNVTAKYGEDYMIASTIINVAAEEMSKSCIINIINNNIAECDETFKLAFSTISPPCEVVIGRNDASEVMIRDDDGAVLSFNQSQYSIEENITPLSVGLMLSRRASKDVIVEVTITNGSAKAGIDYGKSSQSLVYNVTITAGMTSSSFDVDIIDDMIQDGNKMFTITIRLISTCLPVTINSDTTTVTIIDDEVFRVHFSSATFSGLESSGEILVSITITGGTPTTNILVNVSFIEATATGNDFNTTPLIATFPAGVTNTTVRVAVTNDNIVEGDEMFSMSLNVPSSLSPAISAGSVSSAIGTIIDSSTIRVRFTQTQYTGSEATGFVMVTLELVGGTSSNPFSVTVTPSEQSPVSAEGGVDFDTTTLTATFDSGMTMSSVSVPVIDDNVVEENETFNVILSIPLSVSRGITLGSRDSTGISITDSTVAARIISNPISITVLEKATAVLSCEATSSGPIRYQWRRVNGEISSDRAEGVNTSTLTITPVQQEDEDEYYCVASYGVVNGMDHSVESERAKITVFVIVQIATHPISVVVGVNTTVNLSCEATGSGPIRYQWRRVNGEISSDRAEGVNTSTLTISPVQQEDENEYYCVASNGGVDGLQYSDISQRAIVTIYAPSKITVNPRSQLAQEGATLNLSCKATGSGPIRYQWRRVNGEINSDRAEGVNTSTLTISSVTVQDMDEYYCVASNNVEDQSTTAVIAVLSQNTVGEFERSTDDQDCSGNQIIGIAVLSVLLVVAVVSIVGLVIWIVKLNKKLAQTRSKETHQNVPEPTYELVSKLTTDNVNMEKNPSYSITGVQDSSTDHQYDVIPGSDDVKAKKK